jgi:DNA-binding IclR family transcriptional regulator
MAKMKTVDYTAPALAKGLNIVELLAGEAGGLTQVQMAARLGRKVGEIFRIVMTLEQRGFIERSSHGDGYRLSLKLFALAHIHPPTERLLHEALPIMHELVASSGQSVHLAVRYETRLLVLAHVPAPTPISLSVRLGADFPLADTTSGLVITAFEDERTRSDLIARCAGEGLAKEPARLNAQVLKQIRAKGFLREASSGIQGVMNISYPILDRAQRSVAALTLLFLKQTDPQVPLDVAQDLTHRASQAIAQRLGAAARVTGKEK